MSLRIGNQPLSDYFLPRTSPKIADTNLQEGGVDISNIYEPRGTTTKRPNVNIQANGTDISNLFKPNYAPFTLTQIATSNRNLFDDGSWTNVIEHEFTLLWSSNQSANEYFERSGEVRLNLSINDSEDDNFNVISANNTRNTLWKNLSTFFGTITITDNQITKSGSGAGTISPLGWSNISYPSSPVVFYEAIVSTDPSFNDFVRFEISKPQSPGNESNTARRLTIKISFHDTTSGGYDLPQDLNFSTTVSVLYSTNLSDAPSVIETIELPAGT